MRKNKALKQAIFDEELKYKDVAEEMGINAKVFSNKINHIKVNDYEARFKHTEKVWLAMRFSINVEDIE